MVHEEMNNVDLAIADLTDAIKINPTYYVVYEDRAKLYEKKGEIIKAKQDYLQIAKIFTTTPDYNFDKGWNYDVVCRYYSLAGELDKAEPICNNREILTGPSSRGEYDFYTSRGFWYFHKAKYEESIVDFSKAIEINPFETPDSELFSLRAKAYRKLGKIELAIADEKKAKEIEDKDKTTSPF